MTRKLRLRDWQLLGVLVILLLTLNTNLSIADRFDDIRINVVKSPANYPIYHGYTEYEFDIINISSDQSHEVELVLPEKSYGRGDRIGKLTNKAVLAPNSRATLTLYQPPVAMNGNDLAVVVDGKLKKDRVQVSFTNSNFVNYGSGGFARIRVLLSRDVSFDDFNDNVQEKLEIDSSKSSHSSDMPGFIKSESEILRWSDNWLAYTCYDGVVISAEEMRQKPNGVSKALDEYVRAGGTLMVVGESKLSQAGRVSNLGPLKAVAAGFGSYTSVKPSELEQWNKKDWSSVLKDFWGVTSEKMRHSTSIEDANRVFPVVDRLEIPVKGMFVLVIVFAILIGPVNLYILSKKKRRIWMLWTVPVISLIASVSVFAYSFAAEGWRGNIRICGITLLDQKENLATTIGLAGFYSPLTPSGGLQFDSETEVSPMSLKFWRHGRRRMVDWSDGQSFYAGWVTARVPAHFRIRKSQHRRERVEIKNDGDKLNALNGLGADIEKIYYMDFDRKIYSGEMIAAGEKIELKWTGDTFWDCDKSMREVFISSWAQKASEISEDTKYYLKPGTYIAVLNDSVFIEKAMQGYKEAKLKSVVIGTLKGENDEG